MKLNQKDIDEIINLIEELISLDDDYMFVVEGKKDINSLKYLGIKEEKIYSVSNKSISEICETMRGKKIVDFLDNDTEGKAIAKKLKKANVFLDDTYKNKIFSKLHINRTEELKSKLKNIKKEKQINLLSYSR